MWYIPPIYFKFNTLVQNSNKFHSPYSFFYSSMTARDLQRKIWSRVIQFNKVKISQHNVTLLTVNLLVPKHGRVGQIYPLFGYNFVVNILASLVNLYLIHIYRGKFSKKKKNSHMSSKTKKYEHLKHWEILMYQAFLKSA